MRDFDRTATGTLAEASSVLADRALEHLIAAIPASPSTPAHKEGEDG